jgi:hypothetical protein
LFALLWRLAPVFLKTGDLSPYPKVAGLMAHGCGTCCSIYNLVRVLGGNALEHAATDQCQIL